MTTSRQEVLVLCLVESSVTLLHEWGGVLVGYLSPLLQRIASGGVVKGVKNEFRIGFVSYSDPHVHPNPILAKRFFSPPFQLTKELKDDPASLGLGRTASSGRRGMAILEGYVAALEMFDAVADTRPPLRPQPSNEAQSDPSVSETICYLIHIASSSPNKAKKPTWNMDPALDTVTWESLPSHLLKRKIRTSMILIRPIAELQELYTNLSRTPEPFWGPMMKPNHKVLLSGLPPALKDKTVPQKRAATDALEAPPPPARPQPPEQQAPSPVNTTSATATPPTATNPPNIRPPSVTSNQASAVPQPQPQLSMPLQSQPPNLPAQNLDPVKIAAYIRGLELDCRGKLTVMAQARAAGKPKAELDVMQNELNRKIVTRQKLVGLYQQLVAKQQQSTEAQDSTLAGQNLQQINFGQLQGRPAQGQPAAHVPQPNIAASGSVQAGQSSSEHATSNISFAAFGGAPIGKNLQNIPISARPGMEAQMQKMLAERTRLSALAAAPQSQPQPPPQNQVQPVPGNLNMNPAAGTLNVAELMTPRMNLGPHARRWEGFLAWPSANAGGRKENQIAIALYTQDTNLRCESWPQKLILQPSRALCNMATIQAWNKESSPVMGLIGHTPLLGNFEGTAQNIRLFRQLRELIQGKNLLAYCKFDMAGGPPGTGILAFPTNAPAHHDILVAMVFNKTPLPAAVTAHVPMQAPSADAGMSSDGSGIQQTIGSGATPLTLQNMSVETKAFLQQRQAAALAAYNQQQAVQQQQMVPNPPGVSSGPGSVFNVAQFMQNIQAGGDNQMGLGGLTGMQPTQHRQPSGFNPNLQMLQYLNRRPDEGQGQ